jgi:hypothetical protein
VQYSISCRNRDLIQEPSVFNGVVGSVKLARDKWEPRSSLATAREMWAWPVMSTTSNRLLGCRRTLAPLFNFTSLLPASFTTYCFRGTLCQWINDSGDVQKNYRLVTLTVFGDSVAPQAGSEACIGYS